MTAASITYTIVISMYNTILKYVTIVTGVCLFLGKYSLKHSCLRSKLHIIILYKSVYRPSAKRVMFKSGCGIPHFAPALATVCGVRVEFALVRIAK